MKTPRLLISLSLAIFATVLFSCAPATSNNTTTPPTPPEPPGPMTTFDPTDNMHLLIGTTTAPNTHLDSVTVDEMPASGAGNPTIRITGLTNAVGDTGGWTLTVGDAATTGIFTTTTPTLTIPNPVDFSPTNVVITNAITITNLSNNMPTNYNVSVEFVGEAVATWLTETSFTTYFMDATFGEQPATLNSNFSTDPHTITIAGQGNRRLVNSAAAMIAFTTAIPAGYTLTAGGNLTFNASSKIVQADDPDGAGTNAIPEPSPLGTITITRAGDDSGLTFDVVLGPLDALDLTKFNLENRDHLHVSLTGSTERVPVDIREENLPGANPTIVITGLTNTAGTDGGWTLTVGDAATAGIFTTTTPMLTISNPADFSPTNVVMNNAIIITNLNRTGDTDDETNTYDVRVEFTGEAVATWLTAETFTTYFKDATFGSQPARLVPNFNAEPATITITGQNNQPLTNEENAMIAFTITNIPMGYTPTTERVSLAFNADSGSGTVQADDPDNTGTNAIDANSMLGQIVLTRDSASALTFDVVLMPLAKLLKFDPTDSTHLRVSLTVDTSMHLANAMVSVEDAIDENSQPTIVIAGLVNSGSSATAPAIPDKWTLTVIGNAAPSVYSTGTDNPNIDLTIDDPIGFVATNVTNSATITLTNLIFPGDDNDETNTYNVRVDFAEGFIPRFVIQVTSDNVMGSPVALDLAETSTLTMITPCVALAPTDFAVFVDSQPDPTHLVSLARTYYDRNRGDSVENNMISFQQTAEIAETTNPKNVLETFVFTTTFPPCLAAHLGTNKDGNTAASAYELSRPEHLEAVSYLVNESNAMYADKSYTLTADIDLGLAGAPWSAVSARAGFMPIGKDFSNTFKGNFDCAKHTISNLYINEASVNYRGFFGAVDGGTISNCALTKVDITGKQYIGGIAGQINSNSTIASSYATGKVDSRQQFVSFETYIGGLVGSLYSSTITNSYANVTVSGITRYVGGLVGVDATSTIANSYTMGSVTGGNTKGGLIGATTASTSISNSYATGQVLGTNTFRTGGLVGTNDGSTFTNAYWDTVTTMQSRSDGGIGRTTMQMQVDAPVASGVDAVYVDWETTIWSFAAGRYPVLRTVACANRQLNPEATTCEDLPPP